MSEYELAYYGAYHSGLFSQSYDKGKFPKYEKNAPKRKNRKNTGGVRRNWRELKTLVETWNASVGGFDNRSK